MDGCCCPGSSWRSKKGRVTRNCIRCALHHRDLSPCCHELRPGTGAPKTISAPQPRRFPYHCQLLPANRNRGEKVMSSQPTQGLFNMADVRRKRITARRSVAVGEFFPGSAWQDVVEKRLDRKSTRLNSSHVANSY